MPSTSRDEVIDSDGHVIEPDGLWLRYAAPEYRELLERPGGGAIQLTAMQRAYPALAGGASPYGQALASGEPAWTAPRSGMDTWDPAARLKMGRPGGSDPRARLADMDAEGIDAAVLYPTAMLSWIEEVDLYTAACRAYNGWLRDYCAASPSRLFGVAVVPLQDPAAAIAELRRARRELGFKAAMIRPAPYIGRSKLHHPDYDPFWAAAAAEDCPIGVHPSPHGDMPNTTRLFGLDEGAVDPADGIALRQGLCNALDLQVALGSFVLGGICERHPRLRVAFLEGTGGWIAPMLERFDHQFEIFGSRDQKTRPSELFARQCMISFDPDESALAYTAGRIGADKILWASDYPHPDAKIPGVVKELREAVEPLARDARALVLGANARRFYGL